MTKRWVWIAAAAIVLAVFAAQTWSKAHRPDGNDLTSYLLSARALSEGRSPYSPDTPFPYVYPMLLAFLLIPWLALPYGVAVLAWFTLSVAALWLIMRMTSDGRAVTIAAAAIVSFAPVQNTLLNGQVNFFVVLACVLAFIATTRRRDAAAGAWLGVGIALKLMPTVAGIFLLVRGRMKASATAAAVAIVLSLVPVVMLGRGAWDAYADYMREFVVPTVRDSAAARQEPLVFSLPGVVHRWIVPGASRWLEAALAGAVVGVVTGLDIRWWRPRGDDLAAGAAYLLVIVLVSPKSEVHHLAFAIPAVAVCWTRWLRREPPRPAWPGALLFGASAALIASRLAGPAQGVVLCGGLMLLLGALTAFNPSSASPAGSRRAFSLSLSDRPAAP